MITQKLTNWLEKRQKQLTNDSHAYTSQMEQWSGVDVDQYHKYRRLYRESLAKREELAELHRMILEGAFNRSKTHACRIDERDWIEKSDAIEIIDDAYAEAYKESKQVFMLAGAEKSTYYEKGANSTRKHAIDGIMGECAKKKKKD